MPASGTAWRWLEATLLVMERDSQGQPTRLLATLAEAALGVGDDALSADYLAQATALAAGTWMADSTNEQLPALRVYLADSPLKWIKAG